MYVCKIVLATSSSWTALVASKIGLPLPKAILPDHYPPRPVLQWADAIIWNGCSSHKNYTAVYCTVVYFLQWQNRSWFRGGCWSWFSILHDCRVKHFL